MKTFCHLQRKINYKHDTSHLFSGLTWTEILLDKIYSTQVIAFHNILLSKLASYDIKCLNANADRYSPHFTLFNTDTAHIDLNDLSADIPIEYAE